MNITDKKWNESCIKENTRTFIKTFKRKPKDYVEIKDYINHILKQDMQNNGKENLMDIAPWLSTKKA